MQACLRHLISARSSGLVLAWLLAGVVAMPARASAQPPEGLRPRYDLVVYGSTPGGVACAVRAAREGMEVLLVTHARHLGGLLSNGLSVMDALYAGPRAPVYEELRAAIHGHYRSTYGPDSAQYRASQPGKAKVRYEARVVEQLFDAMTGGEPRIKLAKDFYPASATSDGRLVRTVTFREKHGPASFSVEGGSFADCSCEGDLAAAAGVPCRVGRESREEFKEEHAGVIYMRSVPWPPAHVDPAYLAGYRKLNLVHYEAWYEIIPDPGAGAASPEVQAYNLRTILTDDPANRVIPGRPADYDREELVRRLATDVNWAKGPPGMGHPNRKTYWNLPELIGVQTAYVEGGWVERERVTQEHRRLTLALLYFLQNDESVPEKLRKQWREIGLPRDEFPENGHLPYEIYMRETRRIIGREVFTEHDARLAPALQRAPVHADSVSITDWFLDSHACTPRKVKGSLWEGELLLKNITYPGQVSWKCLLPAGLDNLVVPVCLSASHIGWGAVRLEPAWMSLGEAAAWGAVLAWRREAPLAAVKSDDLVRTLVEHGFMVSFFNDVAHDLAEPWYPAVQYLGAQGFFGSYDARPREPLTATLAGVWAAHAHARLRGEEGDATARAQASWQAENAGGEPVSAREFARLLEAGLPEGWPPDATSSILGHLRLSPGAILSRADACRLVFHLFNTSAKSR